jgi:hypothetical protein
MGTSAGTQKLWLLGLSRNIVEGMRSAESVLLLVCRWIYAWLDGDRWVDGLEGFKGVVEVIRNVPSRSGDLAINPFPEAFLVSIRVQSVKNTSQSGAIMSCSNKGGELSGVSA